MPQIYAFDAPTSIVVRDERTHPDRDATVVPEHLAEFYRLGGEIPAVRVVLEAGTVVVTGGHKYLDVASRLARPTVRIVLRESAAVEAQVAAIPGMRRIDVQEVLAAESREPEFDQWHLYFLREPFGPEVQERFETFIRDFFAEFSSDVGGRLYSVSGLEFRPREARICFKVRVSANENEWFGPYLGHQIEFHRTVAGIASFNGHRLPGT
jgi:hypothetical protein